jgi:hypothetical protein
VIPQQPLGVNGLFDIVEVVIRVAGNEPAFVFFDGYSESEGHVGARLHEGASDPTGDFDCAVVVRVEENQHCATRTSSAGLQFHCATQLVVLDDFSTRDAVRSLQDLDLGSGGQFRKNAIQQYWQSGNFAVAFDYGREFQP